MLVETGITENVLPNNSNIMAVDSEQNCYLATYSNLINQYIYKFPLTSDSTTTQDKQTEGEITWKKSVVDLSNTVSYSFWQNTITKILLTADESRLFCVSCKNIRYVNSYYDSSLAYLALDAKSGETVYNNAFSDNPKVGFLGSAHNAIEVVNDTSILLPLVVQCGGTGYSGGSSFVGFASVNAETGDFVSPLFSYSNITWKLALGMATINGTAYIYMPGMLVSYVPSSTSFKYVNCGTVPDGSTGNSSLSKVVFSVLCTDGEYLYVSNINRIYKIRASNLSCVASVTLGLDSIYSIQYVKERQLLLVNSAEYLLVFTPELELVTVLKFFGYTPSAFCVVNSRITILDATRKDIFNLTLDDLFVVQDIRVADYRIIHKNPALFSVEQGSITVGSPVSVTLRTANLLQDTEFSLASAQDNRKIIYSPF